MAMLKKIFLKNKSERGASLLEYALMAALLSVVAIVAITATGKRARDSFLKPAYAIEEASGGFHGE